MGPWLADCTDVDSGQAGVADEIVGRGASAPRPEPRREGDGVRAEPRQPRRTWRLLDLGNPLGAGILGTYLRESKVSPRVCGADQ